MKKRPKEERGDSENVGRLVSTVKLMNIIIKEITESLCDVSKTIVTFLSTVFVQFASHFKLH